MKYNKQIEGQLSLLPESEGPAFRAAANSGHRDHAPRQDAVMVGGVQTAIQYYFDPKPPSPNEMIEKNMVLVEYVYNEPWRRRIHISADQKDELFAEGYLALVKAANGFDRERGVQFNTYASAAIRYAMQRKIREAQRNRNISLYSEVGEDQYLLDTLPDTQQQDLDAELQQRELQNNLLALRERFASKKSIAIGLDALLLKQQGLNCREIGEKWGKPANHVTAVISRTRRTLANELTSIRDCA